MIIIAKLLYSCSSTLCINEVFTNSPWIRNFDRLNFLCHSGSVVSELAPRAHVMADQCQAMAAMWRRSTSIGPTHQADAGSKMAVACPPPHSPRYALSLPLLHLLEHAEHHAAVVAPSLSSHTTTIAPLCDCSRTPLSHHLLHLTDLPLP